MVSHVMGGNFSEFSHKYPEPSAAEDDGLVGGEDGFVFWRDGVDTVPVFCFGCPLRQWGILPLLGRLIPLTFLAFLWWSLVELVRENRSMVFDNGPGAGILIDGHFCYLVALTVVDNDASDLVALPGVSFEPLLSGQLPGIGLVDDAVEIAGEGQFGHIRVGERGRGAGAPRLSVA